MVDTVTDMMEHIKKFEVILNQIENGQEVDVLYAQFEKEWGDYILGIRDVGEVAVVKTEMTTLEHVAGDEQCLKQAILNTLVVLFEYVVENVGDVVYDLVEDRKQWEENYQVFMSLIWKHKDQIDEGLSAAAKDYETHLLWLDALVDV